MKNQVGDNYKRHGIELNVGVIRKSKEGIYAQDELGYEDRIHVINIVIFACACGMRM